MDAEYGGLQETATRQPDPGVQDRKPTAAPSSPPPKLLPAITALNAPYWAGLAKGRLLLQACDQCGQVRFPPSTHCPACLSRDHSWEEVSGHGTLWSWVVFHKVYFPSFRDDVPYNVALVQLDEGPMITSRITGVQAADLRCDMPVRACFEKVPTGRTVVVFQPE
jgi:uncharacterized OB-fold protein